MTTTDPDQVKNAVAIRAIMHEKAMFSEEQSAEISNEFTRLEVQIATLLLAITGVLWGALDQDPPFLPGSDSLLLLKTCFALTLFFLIGSLTLGLLHLKRTEKFWDEISNRRNIRFERWDAVVKGKDSFAEAVAFQEGTKQGGGVMAYTPRWTWILQSVFLGIAIGLLFILAMVLIVVS